MKQLYVRGRDVDPVVPDMKACIDTPSLSSLPSGGVRWTRKTARAMASRRDFGCGASSLSGDRRSAGASHLTKEVQNGYVETINSHQSLTGKVDVNLEAIAYMQWYDDATTIVLRVVTV